jgi:hypothetical protein
VQRVAPGKPQRKVGKDAFQTFENPIIARPVRQLRKQGPVLDLDRLKPSAHMMLTSKLANERNGHQFGVATFLIMSPRQHEPTDFNGAFEVVVNHYIDNREQVAQRRLALKLGCTCHTSSFYFLVCYPLALEVK